MMKKGFTLIELLVAVTLFVTVTVLLISILNQFLARNLSLRQNNAAIQSLNFAIDYITRETRLSENYKNEGDGYTLIVNDTPPYEYKTVYSAFSLRHSKRDDKKTCYKIDAKGISRSKDPIDSSSECINSFWLPLLSSNFNEILYLEPNETYHEYKEDVSYFRVIDGSNSDILTAQPAIEIVLVVKPKNNKGELNREKIIFKTSSTQRLIGHIPSVGSTNQNDTDVRSIVLTYSKDDQTENCCINESLISIPTALCGTGFIVSINKLYSSQNSIYALGSNKRIYNISLPNLSSFLVTVDNYINNSTSPVPDSSSFISRVKGPGYHGVCSRGNPLANVDINDPVAIKGIASNINNDKAVAWGYSQGDNDIGYLINGTENAKKVDESIQYASINDGKLYIVKENELYQVDLSNVDDGSFTTEKLLSSDNAMYESKNVLKNITDLVVLDDGSTIAILSNENLYIKSDNICSRKIDIPAFYKYTDVRNLFVKGNVIGYITLDGDVYTCYVTDNMNNNPWDTKY